MDYLAYPGFKIKNLITCLLPMKTVIRASGIWTKILNSVLLQPYFLIIYKYNVTKSQYIL